MTTDEIVDYCAALEASAPEGLEHYELHIAHYLRAFGNLPQDADLRQAVVAELNLIGLPFTPVENWRGAGVEAVFKIGPALDVIPDTLIPHFERRVQASTRPVIEARFADYLWLKTKKVAYAEKAIGAYLTFAKTIAESSGAPSALATYACRARALVKSLRRDEMLPTLVDSMFNAIEWLMDRERCVETRTIVEVAAPELARDQKRCASLLGRLIALADAEAAKGGYRHLDERQYLFAAASLAAAAGETTRSKELLERQTLSHIAEAGERRHEDGGRLWHGLLQSAAEAARKYGPADRAPELLKDVLEAGRQVRLGMASRSGTVSRPIQPVRDEARRLMEVGAKFAPFAHLHLFGLSTLWWPEKSVLDELISDLAKSSPMVMHMPIEVVSLDGHSEFVDGESRRVFLYARYLEAQFAEAVVLRRCLAEVGGWNSALVLSALGASNLLNTELLRRIAPGIEAFEQGRYWESIHVLVPQIEAVLRQIGRTTGAKIEVHKSAQYRETTLGEFLERPEIAGALTTVHEDLPLYLRSILDEFVGLHLRNRFAHGLLTADEGTEHTALLVIAILLALSTIQGKQLADDASHGEARPGAGSS